MATKLVEIPGIGTVALYKRRGNRSLRLTVSPSGEVRVSMPSWVPYKAGEQFAISKIAWIETHKMAPSEGLKHGQIVGKAHRLHFMPVASATRISTRLRQNQIEISHPLTFQSHDPAVQQAARSASIRALRKEAEQLLPMRLRQLAIREGFTYKSVGIKQLKSRWGSCSSNADITLNLFLMQLPWHLIDYVLLHELTHTRVMQHGSPFWREMELHAPHAKRLRKEIGEFRPVLG
ncbi:MAG TPA: SprT family zinc-dependent metalloprotease [Bacillota bacterium]|nr:SprT family zinc-dependent metalloprotease [Bacillota bacterium]